MHVRIKICGITNPADAELAAALGADAIGLNFYSKSPRFIDEATARRIIDALPPFVDPVALFVNETPETIERLTQSLRLRCVQIHGDLETLGSIRGVLRIPAFPVRDAESLVAINTYVAKHSPAAVLVDAHVAGMFGGTGKAAPWQLLAEFRPRVPLILAGGLTPANVAEAVRIVRPYAVDVASGVESEPGKKDTEKMRAFITAVRQSAL